MAATHILIIDSNEKRAKEIIGFSVDQGVSISIYRNDPKAAIDFAKKVHIDAIAVALDREKDAYISIVNSLLRINRSMKVCVVGVRKSEESEISKRIRTKHLRFANQPFNPEKFLDIIDNKETERMTSISLCGESPSLYKEGSKNPIHFESSKSRELFALLCALDGQEIRSGSIIAKLWPSYDPELAKRLYRDASYKLHRTLDENGFDNLIVFGRGYMRLNKDYPHVFDYEQVSDPWAIMDLFLKCYPWGKEYLPMHK